MYFHYVLSALLVLIAKAFVYLFAPLLALFVTKGEESEVTGYPSFIVGEPRYFLIKPLRWLQTHDAPLDEYFYLEYYKGKWTEKFKGNKWFMRVCWLWRNPAYGVAHSLGYSQQGLKLNRKKDELNLRDTGKANTTFFKSRNAGGQKGFMYFRQIPYGKRCLELYFGWKLLRKDPDGKCMLVVRVKPFKKLK